MPYKITWVEPELLLEHNGVRVYHSYDDNEVDEPLHYWYRVLNEVTEEEEINNTFDFCVKSLSTYDKTKSFPDAIKEAIDKGELKYQKQ